MMLWKLWSNEAQKELARSNQKWLIAAAIIGVAGTLLEAAGGAYMAQPTICRTGNLVNQCGLQITLKTESWFLGSPKQSFALPRQASVRCCLALRAQ